MPSLLTAFSSLTHPPLFSELNMATAGNTEHLLVPKLLVRNYSRLQSLSFLGHVVLKRGAGLLGRCLWPKASISLLTWVSGLSYEPRESRFEKAKREVEERDFPSLRPPPPFFALVKPDAPASTSNPCRFEFGPVSKASCLISRQC